MLRRCIFLISTSENFVSRYLSPSGLARHIGGVRQPAGHEATVLPSGTLPYRPNRAEQTAAARTEYFIVIRVACPIKPEFSRALRRGG